MIDLHVHSTASDGSFTASALMALARDIGLEAMAITDHDTFEGYDQAKQMAASFDIEIICGIEISARYNSRTVHLLGYFLNGQANAEMRRWILHLQHTRSLRNKVLADKLQKDGFNIALEDLAHKAPHMIGRPHFATAMVKKGYASSIREAFCDYLGEGGRYFVPRFEPSIQEASSMIAKANGIPVLAHPIRITRDATALEYYICDMKEMGVAGIEVYHSEHGRAEVELYKSIAQRFSLSITGGSDFHGEKDPSIALGYGLNRNLFIPKSVLDALRG